METYDYGRHFYFDSISYYCVDFIDKIWRRDFLFFKFVFSKYEKDIGGWDD